MILRFIASICLLLACATAAPVEPRTDDPGGSREVSQERQNFERAWIVATLGPIKKHVLLLTELEKRLAAARDYTGAMKAREQRVEMQNELERLDKNLLLLQSREQSHRAAALPERITLAVDAATLQGPRLEAGALTGWSRPGAAATWKLPIGLPAGGYEVVLRYRCAPLEGGSLRVSEARFTLTGDIETTLRGPEERVLGTLKLTENAPSLTLTAATVFKDNLMQLLAVELIPSATH